MTRWLLALVFMVGCVTTPAHATEYFVSGEESRGTGLNMPFPPWDGEATTSDEYPMNKPVVMADGDCVKGSKCLQWHLTPPCPGNCDDMFSEVTFDSTPPNGAGPYYFGFFFKTFSNGVGLYPYATPNGSDESFGKTIDLLGQDWRWVINFGVRGQNGTAGTYNVFVTNPNQGSCCAIAGHFNPTCEVYDTYWNNFNGYGRGLFEVNACQPNMVNAYFPLSYDRWYAGVFKLTLHQTAGEIGLWINGTKIMEFTGIRTINTNGVADHRSLWHWGGTVNQPHGPFGEVKMRADGLVYTNSLSYLTTNGYFSAPSAGGPDTTPPAVPSGVTIVRAK